MPLPLPAVDPASLEVEVEEPGHGFVRWTHIDDLALAGRDDGVYSLDAEAGTIRFGDGVRGRVPEPGMRVRLVRMRGGSEGRAGNVPSASIKDVGSALDLDDAPVAKLKVSQPLPTEGGEDGETLAQAERRIPALFRDRDRAVTEEDYRRLAADTPGVRMGRVELLPRFKPHQRRSEVPGIVTVMTLPGVDGTAPPAPRPDRPFLEAVHAWLDARRPLATELYVIGCEYIPLGIGVSVSVRDGFGRDGVLQAVRDALRAFLWPLTPGGIDGRGWPVGRAVRERELEVVIARVPGVGAVNGISLFERDGDEWRLLVSPERCGPVTLELERWQLPELLSVMVVSEPPAPTDLRALPNPFGAIESVAVPVVPEVC